MPEKKVTVTVSSGQISVDPPSIQVKKAHDNVKWVCDTSPFTIDLPGYPIRYKEEGGKHVGVSDNFPTVGKIKYDVSAPGAETLDPDVDVIP
ncbi:MAG TPA: hypothetical protein VGQ21_07845 [Thermoanaerobaculia bacterium]|jgi:hypothetical protein|nr:hypothetical protein [Thermoanaerobaculia bacterium]